MRALLSCLAIAIGGALALAGLLAGAARAEGTPDIAATVSSSSVLYGDPVQVTLGASNPGAEPYGYNLSWRVVLPAGVSYAGGAVVAPTQIADQPSTGQTTLIFSNISDLSPDSDEEIGFDLEYSIPLYDVGDSFPVLAEAFVNDDPRYIPKFSATGAPEGPAPTSFTGYSGEVSGTQALKAIEVEIEEPSPEGEILRGVHDNQTVYTLKVINNGVNPTSGTKLDAYVPAGLEFLGCGGAGADNTTDAPTNPGSAEEYPGSGPVEVAPLAGCVEPESVETEALDPDGPGPLPTGVYTHVVWAVGTLADGETREFPYRAAVPIRANANAFTGPRPSAASGGQAVNLDNNSGAEVIDETALHTYARASGTYEGATPSPATDEETLTRTAEDWVVRKSADSATLAQGQITHWTLTFETSEYKYVDDAVVTDTLPNGLCPLGPVNYTSQNDGADAECDPVGGEEPSAPYKAAVENADGTWTISWDQSTLAKLGHTGIDDAFTIAFPTRTRTEYQEGFLPKAPILTHDRIANSVETEGAGFARCTAPGTPDCSTPGPKIDFDGVDGSTIVDASAAEQEAGGPLIRKEVAASGSDCLTATYVATVPHYHPGDRVCWKLRVDFPGAVDTSPQAIADYLPPGTAYEAGSDAATPSDNVIATVEESGAGEGLLTWTVSGSVVPAGGQVFEHVFSTIVAPPGTVVNGDLKGNLMKFSSTNTPGESVPLRAEANYIIDAPEVDLVKGVEAVVRGGSTVEGPNGPNVDNKGVEAGDEVTYRVDVSNDGAQDAVAVEVWDVLPAEYQCTAIAAIGAGGECVDATPTDRVKWVVPEIKAGASAKLTYTATVPSDIGPGRTLTNEAGVRQFAGETNLGGTFAYTPAENIDPGNETAPNAPAADDPSDVFTAAAAVGKTRTTGVGEGGNSAATQATIGETIAYTVTATIPEGTTLGGAAELTDTLNTVERQAYVPGSATATLNGGALPGGFTLDDSGAAPKVVFPAGYSNAAGSDIDSVVLSFQVLVTDVAANSRGSSVANQAKLTWTDPVVGLRSTNSPNVSTTIVEPLISQAKSDDANPDRVAPGEIVAYTVTTTNSGAANVSTAHDVAIVDTIPAGLIPVGEAPGNEPLADGAEVPGSGGAIWDAGTRTISKTVATIAPGGSAAIAYRAEVEKPAIAGSSLTNEAEASAASLGEAASGRRTTGSGYQAAAEDTIRLAGAAIAKQVTPEQATPGEPLAYELTVTIPSDLDLFDATVLDVLPSGIAFDGYVAETCLSGPCGAIGAPGRYDPSTALPAGPTTIGWDLGDIAALSEPVVMRLTYDAHLRATALGGAEVTRGDSEVNTATVGSNLTDREGPFDPTEIPTEFDEAAETTSSLGVVEPEVTLDKQIKAEGGAFGDGPLTAHSDETLGYRLIVANEGDSPAYDVELTDAIDPALTDVQVVPQAGVTVISPWNEATHAMTLAIAGPIAPGGKATIEYSARFVAASQLGDGQVAPNTAAIPLYFGVSAEERGANPGWEFREYEGGADTVQAVLDFPTLALQKTTGLSGNPDTGSAEIGQDFPWRVVVSNTSATAGAVDVQVGDVLPPNWAYTAGSTEFDGAPAADPSVTADPAGDRLEWTIPALAPGASVAIGFDARPGVAAATNPGTGAEANVNSARVASASDEAGNAGNGAGPYETGPDTATATLAVPQLTIAKTPDGGSATAGEPSSYTVRIENTGNAVARNLDVEDVLPAGATYAPGSASANPPAGFSEASVAAGPGAGETTVHWAIASLGAGAGVEIVVPVEVGENVADGTTLTNTAAVASDELPDPIEDEGSLEVGAEADMAIEKSGAASYTAGDEYTWQLRVRNLGPSEAQSVVVTDPLPAGTDFVSADAPCTAAGGEVSCALGAVAVGFDQTYDVTVAVDPDTAAAPLDNTATVATSTADPEPANDESTFGPGPSPLADVWVEKTADPAAILRKAETAFTIVVHNDGPSTARGVALEDALPAGLAYVSVTGPGCSEAGGTVSCALGDIAPGGEATVSVTVRGAVNGVHVNAARVTTTTPEPPGHRPNEDTAEVEVGPVADLALEKTAPATVAAGGQLSWVLKVTNNGEDDASGVTIVDPLPAGTAFSSADPGCSEAGGVVSCDVGALLDGQSAERRIAVTVPFQLADTTVVNAAAVHGDQGDDEPANDADEAATAVGPSADLSIAKTGPGLVNADGEMTWTLLVSNAGPSTATGVTVHDALPVGVELRAARPSQGSCGGAGGVVECQLGTLPGGGSAQVQVVAHVPASLQGSTLDNRASVGADEPDPAPENDESGARTAVGPPAPSNYDLSIDKRVDGSAEPGLGEILRYAIEVRNHGPATATGVELVDSLPAAVRYLSASIPGGKCAHDGSAVTCRLASLPAGAERTARLKVRVLAAGTIRNTASVSAAVADADPRNDRSTAKARAALEPATLKVRKERVGKGAVEPGERVRYRIRVRNLSRNAAADVVVCDRLPSGLSFASLNGARLVRGDACWTVEMLPGRGSRTFHLVARVNGGGGGGWIRNVAFAKSDNAPARRGAAGVRTVPAGAGHGGGVTG